MILNNIQYEIRQLTWKDIVKLYNMNMKCDFPKEEIKSLELLQNLYEKGVNKTYGVYEKTELKAYSVFEKPQNCNVILLDYLAVNKTDRGTGLGGMFVKEFKNIVYDVKGIVAEIEDIDKASNEEQKFIRRKRKQFYLRNGFYETGVLTQADGGIDYELLYMPVQQELKDVSIQKAMEKIYSTFFKKGEYIIKLYEYIICNWKHNFKEEPVRFLYEVDLDEERYATRMIEIFADGHMNNLQDKEWGFITEEPVPSVDDINQGIFGEEFSACIISKEEFENIWARDIE